MATGPTGFQFLVDGVSKDFYDMFQPWESGEMILTGFKYGSTDLGHLFAAGSSAIVTKYINVDGIDLGKLFREKSPPLFSITGGSFVTTSVVEGSDTVYNIVVQTGTSILTFYELPFYGECNFQIIGAGGGGGGAWYNASSDYLMYSGAGGGGGGNLLVNSQPIAVNNAYTITVGDGGAGGTANDGLGDGGQSPGLNGVNTSVADSNTLNFVCFGGVGGEAGANDNRAAGGTGGTFSSSSVYNLHGGSGGTGGNGNGGGSGSYDTGTNGINGYFFNNPLLLYSSSISFPTYYKPPEKTYIQYEYSPGSVTLSNWYSVSGGGGGASSTESNQLLSGTGGGGVGSGGLNGGNYDSVVYANPAPPYASFGGGGGGGGWLGNGFPGGNGLVTIWFRYSSAPPTTYPFDTVGASVVGTTIDGSYHYAIFLTNGQIIPKAVDYNDGLSFIVVGGGGGGGGSESGSSDGGGGGGGVYLYKPAVRTNYFAIVGAGGAGGAAGGGGGGTGGISQVTSTTTLFVKCSGGVGGNGQSRGIGGSVFIDDSLSPIANITGGDGGDESDGKDCTYNGITENKLNIPSSLTAITEYISYYYSGGGGGSKSQDENSNWSGGQGGGSTITYPNTGVGGARGKKDDLNSAGYPGNGYGSGGGAGGSSSGGTRYAGGAGKQGIVVVFASMD